MNASARRNKSSVEKEGVSHAEIKEAIARFNQEGRRIKRQPAQEADRADHEPVKAGRTAI